RRSPSASSGHDERLTKPEQATSVVGRGYVVKGCRPHQPVAVVDETELGKVKRTEHLLHRLRRENSVRVKTDPLAADRGADEQCAARREDASQLAGGLPRALRIDRIAIAAKADVLNHMERTEARNRVVCKRQVQDRRAADLKGWPGNGERADVHGGDLAG